MSAKHLAALALKPFLIVSLITIVLILPSATFSQGNTAKGTIDQLRITGELKADGSVAVSQELSFISAYSLDWLIFTNLHSLSITADGKTLSSKQFQVNNSAGSQELVSKITASQWRIDYNTTTTLIRHNQSDQVFLRILEESGYNINEMRFVFHLPQTVDQDGLYGNAYAIQGAYNVRTIVTKPDEIVFVASSVAPKAIFTINASWPKGLFQFDLAQEIRLFLINLEIIPWLILGILLPLVSLFVLWRLSAKREQGEQVIDSVAQNPPSKLSPLLVGVLVDKKVYPKEIVALLIDLCQRGYLVIVKKAGRYYLGLRKPFDDSLEDWEKQLLEEIFPLANNRTSAEQLELVSRKSLYSPPIKAAFEKIYHTITRLNFFAENPHRTRVRYKLVALLLYFLSIIGAVWVAVTSSSPYLLVPIAATLIISYLIIRITPHLVSYTKQGLGQRAKWLAYANYLKSNESFTMLEVQRGMFERHLPYAIALSAVDQWTKRFEKSSLATIKPDWFISYQEREISQFAEELVAFTESISTILSEMRGPLVG